MELKLITDSTLKFFIFKKIKLVQPLNKNPISITLDVSKLDKSKDIKLLQPENIESIFSTFLAV